MRKNEFLSPAFRGGISLPISGSRFHIDVNSTPRTVRFFLGSANVSGQIGSSGPYGGYFKNQQALPGVATVALRYEGANSFKTATTSASGTSFTVST